MSPTARPIRKSMRLIIVVATLTALLIALAGHSAYTIAVSQRAREAQLIIQADLLGRMTSPALTFDDPDLASANLAQLEVDEAVIAAAIYDATDQLFSRFESSSDAAALPHAPGPHGVRRSGDHYEVFQPIVRDGVGLGTVYLRAEDRLMPQLLQHLGVGVGVGLFSLAVVLLLARRLDRVITRPLSDVASAARLVVEEGDFSRRIVKQSDDEVGAMIDEINRMLDEIERGKVQLESRVQERTRELEASNRELIQTKARADDANRAKSSFLATMSHEIRTPMNGVIGMIDVLQQTSLNSNQAEMTDLIRESAFALLTIIDDILDLSKIEAGKLELERAPFSLPEVVDRSCGLMDSLAQRRKVVFLVFIDPRIPDQLEGDALRLRQVLINLISNAIKFSSHRDDRVGRVSVRATLVEVEGSEAKIEIGVEDNGIGMDQATQARLFKAFNQADSSTTRQFGGTGLGLAISRELVDMMGGTISVRSEPGTGSSFMVTLRLPVPSGSQGRASVGDELAGVSCMLIGEDEALASDRAAYLAAAGARTAHAANPAQARAAMSDMEPGSWVWVSEGDPTPASLGALRTLTADLPAHTVRFVAIGRGSRADARHVQDDLVFVGANVLTRQRLVRAVAIATGRAFEADDASTRVPRTNVRVPTRAEAVHAGRLILVAEDNDTNQKVILRQLALLGFAAEVAENGAKALEMWKSCEYGLLLTDLHMPELDGYQLTASIRALERAPRHTPIIALTANALKGEADRCRSVGMDGYLSKPLQLSDLKRALDDWFVGEATSAPPINTRALEALVGDDAATVAGFLAEFRAGADKVALALRPACRDGDLATITAQAHKLRSSAATVGAVRLANLCMRLEAVGRGDSFESLQELWRRFQAELTAVNSYLDALASTRGELSDG